MAPHGLASSAVRPSRVLWLMVPVLVLASMAGCSHKRSSMRPVYGAPVGSQTVVTPAAPGGIITTEPDASEPFLTPAPGASSSNNDGVSRTGISPPVPPEAEPTLGNPQAMPPGSSNNSPGDLELTKPTSLRSTGSRKAVIPTRATRVSLRDAVSPYLVEPGDLFQPPKADRPWKYVVVHHSANAEGGLDQIDRDHRKVLGFEGCGYHFVIGNGTDSPDGQIEVADRWMNQKNGVHCKNGKTADVNEYGIGICLVGNFDQTEPTPKQVAAAKALVAYLGNRYKISSDKIGAHDQFADGPTACPGKNFPDAAIFGPKPVAAR